MPRTATIERNTNETQISAELNLDGTGQANFSSNLPFLEHMLDQLCRHGLVDLAFKCVGDHQIDDHHAAEDLGITLGQAFNVALGDKKGIQRYGHSYIPLDEALSRVVIDFSGRPGLHYNIEFTRSSIGGFDTELFFEFFQGFVNHAKCTVHIDNLKGKNAHHQIETVFKAFAKAIRQAIALDPAQLDQIPSTKGKL